MTEMQNRIAQVIVDELGSAFLCDIDGDLTNVAVDGGIDIAGTARKILEAMREPTAEMVARVPYDMYEPDFAENWRDMIDEALK